MQHDREQMLGICKKGCKWYNDHIRRRSEAMDLHWIEICITTTDEGADLVSARLSMLGINEVSIVQGHEAVERILSDSVKYWDYADDAAVDCQPAVKAYIADLPENADVIERVRGSVQELRLMEGELGTSLGSLDISVSRFDEQDWANNWKAYFRPIEIGERLTVCPSWESVEERGLRAILKIDPGMAFGTGTHHTTRMCLELMEGHISGGETVADIGCGSGILSASAMLLGAGSAKAVDIDPVAVRIAAENAELNGIDSSAYTVYAGDILTDADVRSAMMCQTYDIVLANIVANVIIELIPLVLKLMHEGSVFICSGIIDDRLDEVVNRIKEFGLEISQITASEDWRAVEAVKR